jgi:DNA polymerase-3 subunit epsilon
MTRPRRALLLDTETDGVDPKVHRVIEVAVCLYDLALGSSIAVFSALARSDSNAAEHVNGISVALLSEAFEQERVWAGVCDLMAHADVILAHKASFDRSFVEGDQGFNGIWKLYPEAPTIPWVCTHSHITWPSVEAGSKTSNNLASLALSYGVGVLSAHRAMVDVDILARVLTRLKERGTDLQALVGSAMAPRVKLQALVSFENKDLAKAAGFSWEPTSKRWLKECTADEKFNFKTRPC